LRGWIGEKREAERTRRRLEEKAAEWERLERVGGLLDEYELHEAQVWLDGPDAAELGISDQSANLVDASKEAIEQRKAEERAAQQRELEQQRTLTQEQHQRAEEQALAARQLRRRAVLLTVALVATVFFTFATALFYFQAERARTDAETSLALSTSRQLAAQAINQLGVDPELSILLAKEALEFRVTTEALNALHQALQISRIRTTISITDPASDITFDTPRDQLLLGTKGGQIAVWDLNEGKQVRSVFPDDSTEITVIREPDEGGLVAVATESGMIHLFSWTKERLFNQQASFIAHNAPISGLDVSSQGKEILVATTGFDGLAKLFKVSIDGQVSERVLLQSSIAVFNSIAFDPMAERVIVGSDDYTARIVNLTSGDVLTLQAHRGPVYGVDFSPNGKLVATAGWDATIRIWDSQTGKLTNILDGRSGEIYDVEFSLDNTILASAGQDRKVHVWNIATGREKQTLAGHKAAVRHIAWIADGTTLASVSDDDTVRVWNVGPNGEFPPLEGHSAGVNSVNFNPNGDLLATASNDGTARLWHFTNGKFIPTLFVAKYSGEVGKAIFNPEGTELVTIGPGQVTGIWHIDSSVLRKTFAGDLEWTRAVAYNSTREQIVTAGATSLAVWNVETGELVKTFPYEPGVSSVAIAPAGDILAAGYVDGSVRAWDMPYVPIIDETLGGKKLV
ncbi:MAG: hypothetical protein D6694_03930, partial [Gammaproteobacteria bacterium]